MVINTRQWLYQFFIFSILAFAALAYANTRLDYNLLIGTTHSLTHQAIATAINKLLQQQQPVAVDQYNRNQGVLFKKQLMLEQDFNTLILGRSRTMLIAPEHFADHAKLFNASVDGGGDPAIIGLWQSYKENRLNLNDQLLVEVYFDMIFTSHFLAVKSPPIYPELRRFRQSHPNVLLSETDAQELSPWQYLFSLDYVSKNIKYPFQNILTTEPDESITGHRIFSAGHYTYGKPRPADERVRELAISEGEGFKQRGMRSLERIPELSTFKALISDILEAGLSPILVLVPFNPITYDLSLEGSNILPLVEEWLMDFAQKHNLEVIGSFNPHTYNLNISHFRDGNHPELSAWDIIFTQDRIGED